MFSPTRESRSATMHSVFAQLDVVSIPSGALRFTCSPGTCCPTQQKGARREFTRRAPGEADQLPRVSCLRRIRPRRRTTNHRRTRSRPRTSDHRSDRPSDCCPRRTRRRLRRRPRYGARSAGRTTTCRCSPTATWRRRSRSQRSRPPPRRMPPSTSRPSVPRSEVPRFISFRFLREWGMPPAPRSQSRLEQLQRVLSEQLPLTCTEVQFSAVAGAVGPRPSSPRSSPSARRRRSQERSTRRGVSTW